MLYAEELARLIKADEGPKPPGWKLSLPFVRKFILGDPKLKVRRKFVGNPSLVDRTMVTLATSRGLMLVGEPGTAKSLLSELLAAAISDCSTLTIQGGAATTEDQIKYSWNYALLVSDGPSQRSMVPAPLYTGMKEGTIVRFEEITRCPLEVQDSLLDGTVNIRPSTRVMFAKVHGRLESESLHWPASILHIRLVSLGARLSANGDERLIVPDLAKENKGESAGISSRGSAPRPGSGCPESWPDNTFRSRRGPSGVGTWGCYSVAFVDRGSAL